MTPDWLTCPDSTLEPPSEQIAEPPHQCVVARIKQAIVRGDPLGALVLVPILIADAPGTLGSGTASKSKPCLDVPIRDQRGNWSLRACPWSTRRGIDGRGKTRRSGSNAIM